MGNGEDQWPTATFLRIHCLFRGALVQCMVETEWENRGSQNMIMDENSWFTGITLSVSKKFRIRKFIFGEWPTRRSSKCVGGWYRSRLDRTARSPSSNATASGLVLLLKDGSFYQKTCMAIAVSPKTKNVSRRRPLKMENKVVVVPKKIKWMTPLRGFALELAIRL